MLQLEIMPTEYFNENTNEFCNIPGATLKLEHSLLSLSAWESKYHKPFLETCEKGLTVVETLDYIKFMTLNKEDIPEEAYLSLTRAQLKTVTDYIDDPMTATTFHEINKKETVYGKTKKEKITSEIIYYWMVAAQIPFECESWHLNRLITLIRVCSIKNANEMGKNKVNKKDAMAFNRSLMASRRHKGGH